MTAIQQAVATECFGAGGPRVELTFFELVGKRCYDLLDPHHTEVFLRAGEDQEMHVSSARVHVTDTQQLLTAMQEALGRRETASTGANATSSRSHAVCRLHMGKGLLTLVDLAGSERKEDSMHHDAERRKEAAEINSSLMTLKECIRHRAMAAARPDKKVHIPYRGSNLTKVLKNSLSNPEAHTTVIATASPSATDTEHTMCTFQSICALTCQDKSISTTTEEVESWQPPVVELVAPAKWAATKLHEWIRALKPAPGAKIKDFSAKIPNAMNGAQLLRLAVPRLTQIFDGDSVAANQLYTKIRVEVKRVEDQVNSRRKLIAQDAKQRKNMKSNFAAGFAPHNPGVAV